MLKKIFSNQLISGSLIVTLGTGLAGVANYFYHLLMGRMLGPVDYGVLSALISLVYLLSIPAATLNLVLVKFICGFKGEENQAAIASFFRTSFKKVLPFSLVFLLILLFFVPFLASFLHLPSFLPLILILLAFFISIFLIFNRAFLQGLLRFGWFSSVGILEIFVKLTIAFLLVFWGFKVNGAVLGFLLGITASYLFTFIPLRLLFLKEVQKVKIKIKGIFGFALPVFFSTLAFTSLYSIDVVLARHFLPGPQAGFYGALSVLGKTIFFITSPVITVVFPLAAQSYAAGQKYRHLLWMSIFLVGGLCLILNFLYFLFPVFIIKMLYGGQYLPVAPYLGFFGIFLSLYSLSFLMVNFFLSLGKTKIVFLPVAAGFLQIVFIFFFHQNIFQIILISMILTTCLFLGLLLYFFQSEKK